MNRSQTRSLAPSCSIAELHHDAGTQFKHKPEDSLSLITLYDGLSHPHQDTRTQSIVRRTALTADEPACVASSRRGVARSAGRPILLGVLVSSSGPQSISREASGGQCWWKKLRNQERSMTGLAHADGTSSIDYAVPADIPLVEARDIDELLSIELQSPVAIGFRPRSTGTNTIIRRPHFLPSRFGQTRWC